MCQVSLYGNLLAKGREPQADSLNEVRPQNQNVVAHVKGDGDQVGQYHGVMLPCVGGESVILAGLLDEPPPIGDVGTFHLYKGLASQIVNSETLSIGESVSFADDGYPGQLPDGGGCYEIVVSEIVFCAVVEYDVDQLAFQKLSYRAMLTVLHLKKVRPVQGG